MVLTRLRFPLVLLTGAASSAIAASSIEPVRYSITPIFKGQALTEVEVAVRLRASASGRTVIDLPDRYGGVSDHWRYLSDMRAEGGRFARGGTKQRIILSIPRAPLLLRYRVRSAYNRDPDAAGGNPYEGAIIRPNWFSALGDFVFITPRGRGADPATLTWRNWPSSWTKVATTDKQVASVDQIVESSLLAGPGVQLRRRPIAGGELRLATRGHFDWSFDRYADDVARIVNAQRAFWRDQAGDFTVTLFPLAPSPGVSSMGGTGRAAGFVQYASADTEFASLFRVIAHEHGHTWIPNRLGGSNEDAPAEVFWLSEGFTDFYTAESLLRAGLWTPQQFAADLDRTFAGLASSSARNYPNARIVKDFWTDPAVGQLPYDRGHLFALLLDYELEKKTGTSLDRLLLMMRDRWAAAPAGAKPLLIGNLLQSAEEGGFDVRPLIAKYIDRGETITLPQDLFGPCATIRNTRMPVFEWGFDREASAQAGVFTKVDRNGPAYAAGLRDGMKRVARLGGQEGDARLPLSYRVLDDGKERVISWYPAGRASIPIQTIVLESGAALANCTWGAGRR